MSQTPPSDGFADRYAALQQRVRVAGDAWRVTREREAPCTTRHAPRATLIGASKSQPVSVLEGALSAGLREFGENRVQEAAEKWPALKPRYPDLRLHLIGPLQSNKVREAVALFEVIHAVDRPSLVDALAKEIHRSGRSPMLLVQVNIGAEPQKAGVEVEALPALLNYARAAGLTISGLMCVPPAEEDSAPYFEQLRQLATTYGLAELSMGMSGDFETAIAHGATMVRVGTALFGARG